MPHLNDDEEEELGIDGSQQEPPQEIPKKKPQEKPKSAASRLADLGPARREEGFTGYHDIEEPQEEPQREGVGGSKEMAATARGYLRELVVRWRVLRRELVTFWRGLLTGQGRLLMTRVLL